MAAFPGDARKAHLQVRLLEEDQIEPPPTIPPVDLPGETLSEASVAIVDDDGFMTVHPDRPPGVPAAPAASPRVRS